MVKRGNIMNNMGKRIKELRRKCDLTQEKLADYLGVTYQSVSKWETGVTFPDLALIVPLSRVLGVSTDELLGAVDDTDGRAELEVAYCEYLKRDDHEASYHMAVEAVRDYPNELKYMEWLATMEYTIAYDAEQENGGSLKDCHEFFEEMMDNSMRHYEYVIDNCSDDLVRNKAIFGMIIDLLYLGRIDEAQWYAETVYSGKRLWDVVKVLTDGIPLRNRDDFKALFE